MMEPVLPEVVALNAMYEYQRSGRVNPPEAEGTNVSSPPTGSNVYAYNSLYNLGRKFLTLEQVEHSRQLILEGIDTRLFMVDRNEIYEVVSNEVSGKVRCIIRARLVVRYQMMGWWTEAGEPYAVQGRHIVDLLGHLNQRKALMMQGVAAQHPQESQPEQQQPDFLDPTGIAQVLDQIPQQLPENPEQPAEGVEQVDEDWFEQFIMSS